ncbi:hypothetical protein GXP71_13055 [Cellulomonas sp. H30R-01]|uniref:hypothetical protein n=1 Tax=Cellulomonas sp. H30R-01 TaxID=2704467 RepID=UPI00138D9833|nr:hypothetical protein [Cellulomonas sp. H30R-01]QHT56914.1 hypothetical protein GXP71_13055 [Cellulomonas sp. H30R-01]
MTTRLLLEGTSLAELMAHVRAEFGPQARVVRAERVRSGGIGGFFARERYEITVDVPPPPPEARPAALRAVPAGGLPALLAAADEADEVGGAVAEAAGVAAGRAGAGSDDEPDAASFAHVLEQVRAVTADPLPDPGLAAPPAARALQAVTPRVAVAEPVVEVPTPREPVDVVPVTFPVVAPAASPAPAAAHDLRAALAEIGVPAALLDREHVTLSGVLADVPPAPQPPRTAGSVLVVLGADDDADAAAALLAERLRLPAEAVRLAGAPTGRGGRGRGRTPGRMSSAEQVAAWRTGAPSADHPWVVALTVGADPEDRELARSLLAACEADHVWAVLDARTRTADARRWLRSVTPRVDAVAMRGLLDTAEPGAALAVGVPVAWIDGVPATPVAWAAALSQALGDRARWD